MIPELFYAHILNVNMNRVSLHTRSFRRKHLLVFKRQLPKLALQARKVSGTLEKRAQV